jgi:hypothetical protein
MTRLADNEVRLVKARNDNGHEVEGGKVHIYASYAEGLCGVYTGYTDPSARGWHEDGSPGSATFAAIRAGHVRNLCGNCRRSFMAGE